MSGGAFYLGIDVGTQSLTAILVEAPMRGGEQEDRAVRITSRVGVHYDSELPAYGTVNGQLPNDDPAVGRVPPCMWLDALDLAFEKLGAEACRAVRGVSVSGQQHGSVYLRRGAEVVLQSLSPERRLGEQIEPVLSRSEAPIWTDSSTTRECEELRRALGGATATAELTGSDTFERFTGPQIRRFARTEPKAWADTAHVCLVSSFVTSVLAGRVAPIDHGDGSGMNLLDIRRRQWSKAAMTATAEGLHRRLAPPCPPWTVVGRIAPCFVSRYGLPASAQVVAGSGDNPCSLVGVGVREPGEAVLSLGTSDTYFGLLREVVVDPEANGHVFIAPSGHPMSLICFRNGSLAREAVRDRFGFDWSGFDAALRATPPGNDGLMMLPWFEPRSCRGCRRPACTGWVASATIRTTRPATAGQWSRASSCRCGSTPNGWRPGRRESSPRVAARGTANSCRSRPMFSAAAWRASRCRTAPPSAPPCAPPAAGRIRYHPPATPALPPNHGRKRRPSTTACCRATPRPSAGP